MKKAVYFIWQCLWGAPQSLLGLLVFLRWRNRPHFWYHGALVTVWGARGGMSLGLFVFIPAAENQTARPDAPAPGTKEQPFATWEAARDAVRPFAGKEAVTTGNKENV